MNDKQQLEQSKRLFRKLNLTQTLRWRLLVLLSCILLLTLLVIGASVFYFISLNEQQVWQNRQTEAAHYSGQVVSAFMQRMKDTLTLVAGLRPTDLTNNPQVLADLLQQNSALLELIRLDANGRVLASAHQDVSILGNLFTVSQSNWFIQASQGEFYLGDVQISPTSEPYLIMAIPTRFDGGVVAARLHMTVLWEAIDALQFGQTGQAYIVNFKGQVIAHKEPEVALAQTTLDDRSELTALIQAENTVRASNYSNFKDQSVRGIIQLIPETRWVVITEINQNEIVRVSRTALILLSVGLLGFGAIIMLVTSRFLSQLIFQPMDTLRTGAEKLGQGDLSHQIMIDQRDEVGQVAETFNEMARYLHERDEQLALRTEALANEAAERKLAQEKLELFNQTLEKRVSERTAALERSTKQLLRSNKELEKFAYVASHDLQEPLRKVQAFSSRVQSKYSEQLDERGRDYLVRMQDAAGRMQTLINDLLMFSRVATKAQPFATVDLNTTVQGVLSDLELQIDETDGQVEVATLPTIQADPTQMRQLFQNLIGNALKFRQTDTPPLIKIDNQTLNGHKADSNGLTADPHTCQITVADNGIGFDEKYLDRVFQVFQRLHGRNSYSGTGVGLAICRRIIERHNGAITAKSKPDQGATFVVTLPIQQSPEEVV